MKKKWKEINNLLNCKNKKTKSINALKDYKNYNKVTRDLTRIPNILNNHFATVGQRLASRIPPTQKCFTDFLRKTKSPDSSFFFQPIAPTKLQLEILSIRNNKSHGLYSRPTQILKYASDFESNVLADILNWSISIQTKNVKNHTHFQSRRRD